MWRNVRVSSIQAPLFWPLVFFWLGLYAWDLPGLALSLGALFALIGVFRHNTRVDLMLSIAFALLGYLRMEHHITHHPKCVKKITDYWICTCPLELDAACICVSQHSHQSWSVEISSRDFTGKTNGFWGRLEPFYSSGDFDVAKWKYTKDISGKLFPLEMIKQNRTHPVVRSHFEEMRHTIRDLLHHNFEKDAESLLLALFLGDKSSLSKPLKHAFSNGGIAHVLAVSGYHIGLVGMIPLLCIRNRRRWVRILGIILFPAIWIYVLLCHAPISAVRAATMSSAYLIGSCTRRYISPFQCWSMAGFIVLLWKPHAAMALGTQLSFAAVAAILIFFQTSKEHGISNPWLLSLGVPIAAQFGTLAWTANVFGRFPLAFLPMNVLIAPAMSALGMASLFWIGTHQFDSLSEVSNAIAQGISTAITLVFEFLAYCDHHFAWAPSIQFWNSFVWILLTSMFFVWNIALLAQPHERALWTMRCLGFVLITLPWIGPWFPFHGLNLETVRSNTPTLIGKSLNGQWIVSESDYGLNRALQSVKNQKRSFYQATHLTAGKVTSWEDGWMYLHPNGNWSGWIQSRPFSWNRTGEKNNTKKISFGERAPHWMPWCPEMNFNSNEGGWLTLDQHTPATLANRR
jgi:ComEC/Rec2-related protein